MRLQTRPSRRSPAPLLALLAVAATGCSSGPDAAPGDTSAFVPHMAAEAGEERSAAYRWLDVILEAAARDVEQVGAQPTILSRQMAIPLMAMYEAWAAFDETAVGQFPRFDYVAAAGPFTQRDKEVAIAVATYVACVDQFPRQREYVKSAMRSMGFDPNAGFMPVRTVPIQIEPGQEDPAAYAPTTPAEVGREVAGTVLRARRTDGANQRGDREGSDGAPYSDYTGYEPINPPDRIIDPDRWQPIPFDDGNGGKVVVPYLTPHWHLVEPFGLASADQFRPGPPPKVGSAELRAQVDECIEMNASLDPQQKALVEFMRDGPRSTGQSGHWLRFAQDVSVRDGNSLDEDVKLFFAVGVTAMDAFIASWDSKRHYDSSRPWTLVRHYYPDETIKGWGGPGKGTIEMPGSEWHPYSPSTFITPPFPGYTSGHSTVSAACAKMLELHTGSDRFMVVAERHAGELTEEGASCEEMQQWLGRMPEVAPGEELTCEVDIPMATFTEAAELAGISRVLGGYHIQADNIAGLELGRDVAEELYPKVQAYFRGERP